MIREVNTQSSVSEIQKSQFLRVVDVLALGPFMIYAGTKLPTKPLQTIMIVAGALVIVNNLNNYLKNKSIS
jgi:hypothetical protein